MSNVESPYTSPENHDESAPGGLQRALALVSLIIAGEVIFVPTFQVGRYFKASLLSVFGMDELELGYLMAIYGIVAMISYPLGGPLADKFAPRKLMAASLVATGIGTVYMATVPNYIQLKWLFGFWGVSTILGFWSPLIRATREWGGRLSQGRAFGLLDGGRGLVATSVSAAAAFGFTSWVGSGLVVNAVYERTALQAILLFYAACCGLAAALVWVFLPDRTNAPSSPEPSSPKFSPTEETANAEGAVRPLSTRIIHAATSLETWLQATVVVAAYCAFKAFGFFAMYCEDGFGVSRADSSQLAAWLTFLRVVGAIGAGWIADRLLGAAATVCLCFVVLIVSFGMLPGLPAERAWLPIALSNLAVGSLALYALRGVYFALLEESGTPRSETGTTVGLISFVGFTPDIFMPPLMGYYVSTARAAGDVRVGYQQLFWTLAGISMVGLVAAVVLAWMGRRRRVAG